MRSPSDSNAARVNFYRATENSYPGSCGAGSPGQSHSRLYCAGTNAQYFSNDQILRGGRGAKRSIVVSGIVARAASLAHGHGGMNVTR